PAPSVSREVRKTPVSPPAKIGDWHELAASLEVGGIAQQLANNCQLVRWEKGVLHLALDGRYQQLHTSNTEQRLLKALKERLGSELVLKIQVGGMTGETPAQRQERARTERRKEALASMRDDQLVQELELAFSARLAEESVKPIDPE
ncbi:MAG TPA: hypothetical protein EYH03_06750, partial [Chromatiales bacterium]|nr:hypothetical protein [Chromatiales bacterium]